MTKRTSDAVSWAISDQSVAYADALAFMQARAEAIATGTADEIVWLVEHPPLYTAGTSARPQDLLAPDRFPVHTAGRGGQYTYHGPGQRVVYVMLDVRKRYGDVRAFVSALERLVINTLARFNIKGEIRPGRVGVWVARPDKGAGAEDKIAAIGIRLRRWVSFHGLAINVDPDLEHFSGIVPCGISEHGVTSFLDLGRIVSMAEIDMALRASFEASIAPTVAVDDPLATTLATGTLD
ncbi:MAG: lipoyl(octanoyl) transferase LipB [Hyphomicrobiaceae bacterium]|nr:lipoyl(octanoyl) transferase LipB [Hyphomicrobiaceae bacterium]